MPNLIAHTLSSVTLGNLRTHDSLTMFPLLGPDRVNQSPFYLTLDQALSDGWTEVTEVSDQGSVPNLLVVNKAEKPVFILDGEELVGAKQNRVVNLSILVPARSELTIPVSCVEAGRWRARSRAFSSAPRTQYAAGRAMRMRQVTESMQMSRARTSDQAAVWADIAEKSARMDARSETGAMEEIFAVHAKFAESCLKALAPSAGQCGALFLIDGRVVGFDLFDRAVTLRRLLPKLVRSVAIDAVDKRLRGGDSDNPRRPAANRRGANDPRRPNLEVGRGANDPRRPNLEVGRGANDPRRPNLEVGRGANDPRRPNLEVGRGASDPRRPNLEVGRGANDPRRPDLQVGRGAAQRLSPDLLLKVAQGFLERTCAADVHEDDAVGMGRDLRLSAPKISGAALVANAAVVHLSAFHA